MAYSRASKATFFLDDQRMTSIRVLLSRMTTKKVPALALVVVGLIGMVAGVLAATLTVSTVSYNGESGTLHTNTGNVHVTDLGLGVVANDLAASGSGTFSASSTVNTDMTAGDWFYKLSFTDSVDTSGSHTITVMIRNGTGIEPSGPVVATFTVTSAATPTGTITAYVDLKTTLTTPITVYVKST